MGILYELCVFYWDARPTMRVVIKIRVGGVNKTRMWGFPHSSEPEEIYEGELWVEVTLNGWRPRIWALMKETSRL